MYFLFMVNADDTAAAQAPPDEFASMMAAVAAFDEQMMAEGRIVGSLRLLGPDTARTIRSVDGQKLVIDGPFADTKEHLGGFWIIEAADMDQAMSIADRLPSVSYACIEVRPVLSLDLLRLVQEPPAQEGV